MDPLMLQLAQARVRAGLTIVELASRAGLSRRTILDVEAGRAWPTLWTLRRIVDALGFTLLLVDAHRHGRQLRPHGTAAAANRHRYHGEPLCQLCRDWDAARKRAAAKRSVT